jgi:hypothetical protein
MIPSAPKGGLIGSWNRDFSQDMAGRAETRHVTPKPMT